MLLSGCFGPGEGVEVPLDQIYFPVGLSLDKDQQHLFVVSSDFDLQYNGGAIQSYDLDKLEDVTQYNADQELPHRCATDDDCHGKLCEAGLCVAEAGGTPCKNGDRADGDRLLYPGRCNPIDPRVVQTTVAAATDRTSAVKIGAFATDSIIRTSPDGSHQRLFVPVRGDSTLHWLDIEDDGGMSCGQQFNSGACDAPHRAGDDADENERDIELGPEPYAITATDHAENIVVTNQTTGTVALFTNFATTDDTSVDHKGTWTTGPKLEFALASSSIPSAPVGVAAVPLTLGDEAAAYPSDPEQAPSVPNYTFMMTFRNSAQVRLFRYAGDDGSSPARPYLVDGGGVAISANSVGSDSRGIAIDDAARKDAERDCFGDAACLSQAALVPLDVYVANRAPASLLVGRTQPPGQYPYFFQTFPLTAGPSRIVIGKVHTADDVEETRVFVTCFDSRRIFVYDPKRSRIETEILTGRGAHAVAIDTERRLLYVGHFTDSYVGVYSLDLAFPETYGTMLGTLGSPNAPRSSK